jgi:hypothetical protein
MTIYALPGHKICFAEGTARNGYPHDQENAQRYLTAGCVYTVKRTSVGKSNSSVYIEEVPGVGFNTVQFESVTAQPRRMDRQHPDFIRYFLVDFTERIHRRRKKHQR